MSASVAPRARNVIVDLAACGRYHFTSPELRSALGVSDAATRQALNRFAGKGEIASPARGFYVIVPPEDRRLGCLPVDQFIPARPIIAHRTPGGAKEVLITSGEIQTIEFWPCTEEETPNAPR